MSGPGLAIRIPGEISKESGLIKLSTFEDKVWTVICSGCLFYALLTTGDWTDGKGRRRNSNYGGFGVDVGEFHRYKALRNTLK